MGGLRLLKPPTRRQIASKTLETIAVVNASSKTLDVHHDRLARLEAWQQAEQALTGWQRLKRLVGR